MNDYPKRNRKWAAVVLILALSAVLVGAAAVAAAADNASTVTFYVH